LNGDSTKGGRGVPDSWAFMQKYISAKEGNKTYHPNASTHLIDNPSKGNYARITKKLRKEKEEE